MKKPNVVEIGILDRGQPQYVYFCDAETGEHIRTETRNGLPADFVTMEYDQKISFGINVVYTVAFAIIAIAAIIHFSWPV